MASKRKEERKEREEVKTAHISATPAFIFITTTLAEREKDRSQKGLLLQELCQTLKRSLFSVIMRIQRHAELGENGEEKKSKNVKRESQNQN